MSQTIANLMPVLISMKKENIIPSVEYLSALFIMSALFIISILIALALVNYMRSK